MDNMLSLVSCQAARRAGGGISVMSHEQVAAPKHILTGTRELASAGYFSKAGDSFISCRALATYGTIWNPRRQIGSEAANSSNLRTPY